ncbi:hypothetical protein DdX_19490 [Ditylenchus destructor]|uniref:Uncharacterized protein n=1 Tax=Ditylenchus destructor TaxID=166010 RepID=A0AAD4MIA2_9BILA|nr:hypothetical protein DdX_19490 [Ditylenchus destructor]
MLPRTTSDFFADIASTQSQQLLHPENAKKITCCLYMEYGKRYKKRYAEENNEEFVNETVCLVVSTLNQYSKAEGDVVRNLIWSEPPLEMTIRFKCGLPVSIIGDRIEHIGESAARIQFDKDGYLTLEEIRQTIADEAFYRQILLFRRNEL